MAVLWLKWVSFLCTQREAFRVGELIIFGTQRITPEQWTALRNAAADCSRRFSVALVRSPEEDESGYPKSASHLFLKAMEHCEQNFPGRAVLWMETDAIPVTPDWFEKIRAEYQECGKSFMGVYVEAVNPHMTGNAVYPPDWRTQAPAIATVLSAPDDRQWGKGRGQPWDTWAGAETTAKMHRAKTIQQIWRPASFNIENLKRVLPETQLFHQCKNGSLITTIARVHYPQFLLSEGIGDTRYSLMSSKPEVSISGWVVKFTPCARAPGGGLFSVTKPASFMEEALLAGAVGTLGIEEISHEDFKNLINQSARLKK